MTLATPTPPPAPPSASDDAPVAVTTAGRGPQAFTTLHLLLLLAITGLAAFLRLFHLGEWSLWVDEGHTWRDATMPLWGKGGFFETERAWYPLPFLGLRWLLEHGWLPSTGEGWLRLPFAFFGIVSVPLLALVGNLLVGRRGALLAALFLALHPWHIGWSQSARGYVLMFFFVLAAVGAYWRWVERRSRGYLWATLLMVLLAGLSHASAYLLLLPFVAYPLLNPLGPLRSQRVFVRLMLFAGIAVALGVLALNLPFLEGFARSKSEASLLHMVQTTAFYFRLPLLVTAVTGVWMLFQTRLQGRILFLACLAVLPILGAAVAATVLKVNARYAFCALPSVMLLCGAASVRMTLALQQVLAAKARWVPALPSVVLPAILCLDMASYDYFYFHNQRGDRGSWREAVQYVTAAMGHGSRLSVYTVNEPTVQYYLRPRHYAERSRGDPYPDRDVQGIVWWDIRNADGKPGRAGGAHRAPGGEAYLLDILAWAKANGTELFFVVSQPELAEQDQDGSLRAAMAEHLELRTMLPNYVGPRDESIWIYGVPRQRR